jgi:hypothetical protein
MRRLSFAIGVLALVVAAGTPARADYAVVKFETGFCRIWWDSQANPYGTGWTKVVTGLPNWEAAWSALNAMIKDGACR